MMSFEEVVRRILSSRPDLTKENILGMVKLKRESAGRLLTEEGAAYMVANDLGIDIAGGALRTTLSLKDLIVGTSDVTVTGKVILTYPTQTFSRKNGALGKVGRFVLQDETASVNIVLWDEKAEMLESGKLASGMTVRVNHGYVRAGLSGRPEVNVGARGSVLPSETSTERTGAIREDQKKIRDIKPDDILASLVGIVSEVSPPSGFTRADGRTGRVARLRLGDETGRIRVVLWDENAEVVETLTRGDALKITNGRVRLGLNNEAEIHVNRTSQVERLQNAPSGLGAPKPALRKIRDLSPGLASVDVIGRVIAVGQIRLFERPSGGQGRVGDLILMDETGSARLSLWDEKAEMLERVTKGDAVLIESAYTRTGLGGSVSLNLGRLGTFTVNPPVEEAKALPLYSQEQTPIANVREGLPVSIEGTVLDAPSVRQVTTRDGRELTVTSLRLGDSTGEIRASFWQDNAEKARQLPVGARLKITDAFARVGFDGDLEISTRSTTKLEVMSGSDSKQEIPKSEDIAGYANKSETYDGEARIVELLDCEVEGLCPKCKGKVVEVDGEYICRRCDEACEPNQQLVVRARMEDDDNRRFNAVFSDKLAEKLIGMRAGYVQNLLSQGADDDAPLELVRRKLIGKKVKLKGKISEQTPDSFNVRVEQLELS